jgi:hypothetical protein
MMGQQPRIESLFYYFRLEDQIPENHLLRLIDRHVDLSFVRERVKSLYSSTGRPSVGGAIALAAGGLSLRHYQRAATVGRSPHASSLSMVHAARFESGSPEQRPSVPKGGGRCRAGKRS